MAVPSQSLIQNSVDSTKWARVNSLSTGIVVGFPSVGALILGLFGDWGVQGPTLIAGVMCLIYSILAVRCLLI
jgi:hypothetical protein